MKKRIVYIIAIILLVGGVMGLLKNIVPNLEWLSFRYFINGDNAYQSGTLPMYARIYGIIMAILELLASCFIFTRKKKLFIFCIITLIINCIGCMIAIILGDLFAIVSLIVRVLPLYILYTEYINYKKSKN